MKPQIGFDTLHLNPVQFDLEPHFQPSRRFGDATPENENGANFPLYSIGGRTFEGVRAYQNEPHFMLEMFPYTDIESGTFHVSTKVQLTVPKVCGTDNYHPADRDTTAAALELVERELAAIGFKTDLKSALVKRCDIAKTIQLRDSWQTYVPVLAMFKPKQMSGTGFESGQRWGNSLRQLCLYEKGLEMASKVPKSARAAVYASVPKNSTRIEMRLTEKKSFQAATGMRTAADLLSDFGHVEKVYRSEFEQKLFRFKPSEVEKMKADALSIEDIAVEMLAFIQGGDRFWLTNWIHADWVTNRVIDAERQSAIKAAIRLSMAKAGLASQNASKHEKRLDSLFMEHAKTEKAGRSVADLYRELQTKVLEI